MFKKVTSIALIMVIANSLFITSILAGNNDETDLSLARKVEENITRLGIGESAKVKVTLKDGTKLEGYVSQKSERTFTVINPKTGRSTEVEYSQVKKAEGGNLSTGAKIAIGVGIGVAILIIALLANRDVDCQVCP